MSDLPTHLLVAAALRRCVSAGKPAYVVRKGAEERGTVIVQVLRRGQGPLLFTQSAEGWMNPLDEKGDAEAYIARAVKRDPDVWVVEVEDDGGNNPFVNDSPSPFGRGSG